jgi:hypothetical protein
LDNDIIINNCQKKPNINSIKFNDIVKFQQSINDNNIQDENPENQEIDNNNINNIPENENINNSMEIPITDDLDLLLYNNHGNL